MVIVFWDFLMFDSLYLSPQVKQSVIINNKHDIYELPDVSPNTLGFKKHLRQLGNISKVSKLQRIIADRSVLPQKFCQY